MKHGQPVKCSSVLKRMERWESPRMYKTWEKAAPVSDSGLFLGYRTLSNGFTEFLFDEGPAWTGQGYIRVALVSFGLKTNPVYVALDAIEEVTP